MKPKIPQVMHIQIWKKNNWVDGNVAWLTRHHLDQAYWMNLNLLIRERYDDDDFSEWVRCKK